MKQKKMGKCCVCGRYGELSFEHVPPRSAFNKGQYVAIDYMSWIQSNGTWANSKKVSGGLGAYTLCRKCNSIGGRYGREYKEWAVKFKDALKNHQEDRWEGVLKGVYPLRLLKETITLFCSLNGPNFTDAHPYIRDFIMKKRNNYLEPQLTIMMYLNTSRFITRTGITGLLKFNEKPNVYVVSEHNFPPFGFALYFGPARYNEITDITFFKTYDYDEKTNVYLDLPILNRHYPTPADYRTDVEIIYDRVMNQVAEIRNS